MIPAFALLLAVAGDNRAAPIFVKHCLGCHNHELNDGGISFDDPATLLRVVAPGKPDESALMRAVLYKGNVRMPPGKKLSRRDIAIIRKWILEGAK